MVRKSSDKAFTLIELLVVVAIIALLISILLPALSSAREQGKRAVCLANMRSIAQGASLYSSEDSREHAVPVQQQMVSTHLGDGFTDSQWALKSAMPYCYGGRTPQIPFPGGNTTPAWTDDYGRWSGKTRPLNRYVYNSVEISDYKNMGMYRCPSDVGLPSSPFVIDVPITSCADRPCYNMFGNSYRINVAGMFFLGDLTSLTVAPLGHRSSTLRNPARLVIFMEPLFYSMTFEATQPGGIPDNLLLRGWHKKVMTANVSYVDGSGRATKVHMLEPWLPATLQAMGCDPYVISAPFNWLRRGKTWQMECYPTPGAVLPKYSDAGIPTMSDDQIRQNFGFVGSLWPWNGVQNNTHY